MTSAFVGKGDPSSIGKGGGNYALCRENAQGLPKNCVIPWEKPRLRFASRLSSHLKVERRGFCSRKDEFFNLKS